MAHLIMYLFPVAKVVSQEYEGQRDSKPHDLPALCYIIYLNGSFDNVPVSCSQSSIPGIRGAARFQTT